MITSNQNPKIQKIRAIQENPKERKKSGLFVVEGVRLFEEAFHSNWNIELIFFSDNLSDRGKDLLNQAKDRNIFVEEIPFSLMKKISDTDNPQGIIALIQQKTLPIPNQLNFVLICDSINDPGNLGTILRSADAAKIQAVFISQDSTDPYSPKVVRAGMGAHFRLPVYQLNWVEINAICKSKENPLTVFLADADTDLYCWQADLTKPLAIIVGNEATGPGSEAYSLADFVIKIPMPGEAESLNASVAASILLFETVRQRWK